MVWTPISGAALRQTRSRSGTWARDPGGLAALCGRRGRPTHQTSAALAECLLSSSELVHVTEREFPPTFHANSHVMREV